MDDLISRQAAIDAIKKSRFLVDAMEKVIKLPPAHPEVRTQVSSADDLISRQAAINAVKCGALSAATVYGRTDAGSTALFETVKAIKALPPAQPEIIRCKDCKWFGDIGCAISIVDDSDKPTENDFCSFAERKTDE